MNAWKAMNAWFDLIEAEARTGITVVEAAAVDEFETQLRMVTTTSEERADIREAALELAKAGLTSADIQPMARTYHLAAHRLRGFALDLNRYADEMESNR